MAIIEIDEAGDFVTKCGFTEDDIAQASRNAFLSCLGAPPVEWEKVGNNIKEFWRDAVGVLLEPIRLQIEIGWVPLSRKMSTAFYRDDKWESLPEVMRIAWEVAAREGVNYYLAEDADDLREVQDMDWMNWASRRLQTEGES